jgi:hypothetical protein
MEFHPLSLVAWHMQDYCCDPGTRTHPLLEIWGANLQ